MLDLTTTLELPAVKRAGTRAVQKLLRDRLTSGHSYSPVSLAKAAEYAREAAAVDHVWARLEAAGLVRLEVRPDEDCSLDDLAGDTYDVELNKDTVPGGERTIVAQRKAFEEQVERDGVYGVVGQYRPSPEGKWVTADSCWGMVGYDNVDKSEIAYDVKHSTLVELAKLADLHRTLERVAGDVKWGD